MHLERLPNPIDSYAQDMFRAIIVASELPNGECKERLLYGLSHAIAKLFGPQIMMAVAPKDDH